MTIKGQPFMTRGNENFGLLSQQLYYWIRQFFSSHIPDFQIWVTPFPLRLTIRWSLLAFQMNHKLLCCLLVFIM